MLEEVPHSSFGQRPPVPWSEVYGRLAEADSAGHLDVAELERLAVSAYLTGRDGVSARAWERAHAARLERGEVDRAAAAASGWRWS